MLGLLPGHPKKKEKIILPLSLLEFVKHYHQSLDASVELKRLSYLGKITERARDNVGYISGYLEGKKWAQKKLKTINFYVRRRTFSMVAKRDDVEITMSWRHQDLRVWRGDNTDNMFDWKRNLLYDLGKHIGENFAGYLKLLISHTVSRGEVALYMDFFNQIKGHLFAAELPHWMLTYLEGCTMKTLTVNITNRSPYVASLSRITAPSLTINGICYTTCKLHEYPLNSTVVTLKLNVDDLFFTSDLLWGDLLTDQLPEKLPNVNTITLLIDPFLGKSLAEWSLTIRGIKGYATKHSLRFHVIHYITFHNWDMLVNGMITASRAAKVCGKIDSGTCDWEDGPITITVQRCLPPGSSLLYYLTNIDD